MEAVASNEGKRILMCERQKHTVGGGCRWLPGSYVERAVDLEDRLDVQLLSLSKTMSSAQEHRIPPHN